jgi:sugar diacid utilization regulator
MDISNEDSTDPILTIEWVLEQLEEIKKNDWYLAQITLHYFAEDCNLTRLSKKIGIPINNLSRDIRKVKVILNDKLQEKLKE